MEISVREMGPTEYRLLPDFLYHAIYVPEGVAPPDGMIIHRPEFRKYYEKFGREGDSALLALDGKQIVGAIWGRVWSGSEKGYGYVQDAYQEISISVLPRYRGMGIGGKLLDHYIAWAKQEGIPGLSLSVNKENFAFQLYQKAGFVVEREGDTDFIMRLDLAEVPAESGGKRGSGHA